MLVHAGSAATVVVSCTGLTSGAFSIALASGAIATGAAAVVAYLVQLAVQYARALLGAGPRCGAAPAPVPARLPTAAGAEPPACPAVPRSPGGPAAAEPSATTSSAPSSPGKPRAQAQAGAEQGGCTPRLTSATPSPGPSPATAASSPGQDPAAITTPTTATKPAPMSGPLPSINPQPSRRRAGSSGSSPGASTTQLQELLSPRSSSGGSPSDSYTYITQRAPTSAKPLIRMSLARGAAAAGAGDAAGAATSPRDGSAAEARRCRSSPLPKLTLPPALKNVAPSIRSAHEAALHAAAAAAAEAAGQKEQQQREQQREQQQQPRSPLVLPQVLPEQQANSRLSGRGGLHDLAVARDQGAPSLLGCSVEDVAARATEALGLECAR